MDQRHALGALTDDIDDLLVDEARRGTRVVLPFTLSTLGLVWVILGDATRADGVRVAFGAALVAALLRFIVFRAISRPSAHASAASSRAARLAFTASSWLLAATSASIYLTAGPAVTAVQLLVVTVLATATCTLAILSATSSLLTYVGFVSIHLMSLAFAIERHRDLNVMPAAPLVLVSLAAALTVIARENIEAIREKVAISMEIRDFGFRDALTGLRNRAFVELVTEQRASQIVAQWQNSGRRKPAPERSLALLLVDIDHFKKINDRYGHASGDQVLAAFATVARSAMRAGDIVARWGGEEFLVVMEVDDRQAAHAAAERLRGLVASTPVADASGRRIDVTCSIGGCLFPFDATRPADLTWRETLELADAALYRAKSTGRNRTRWTAPDPDFTPRQILQQERDSDADTLVFRKSAA